MSGDEELRTLGPGRDPLTEQIRDVMAEEAEKEGRCKRLDSLGLDAQSLEREASACFLDPMGCDPFACPLPPVPVLARIADAVPVGLVRAELLYVALHASENQGDFAQARSLLGRLRDLRTRLARRDRREVDEWLDTFEIDLVAGDATAAIAKVRRSGDQTSASSLIASLIQRGELDRAFEALALLRRSDECAPWSEGFGMLHFVALSNFRPSPQFSAFLDRLPQAPQFKAICPNGLAPLLAAELELAAERFDHALVRIEGVAQRAEAARLTQLAAEGLRRRGEVERARTLLLRAADLLPTWSELAGSELDGAAMTRLLIIHSLAQLGEGERAAALAQAYPGPGWRGYALSLVAANLPRAGEPADGWESSIAIDGGSVSPLH